MVEITDAASYDNRDTNGSYGCTRETIQTHGLILDSWFCFYGWTNIEI